MTAHSILIPDAVRWDELAVRRFVENAPYYLDGSHVRTIRGRVVELDGGANVAPVELELRVQGLAQRIAGELRDAAETILAEYTPEPFPAVPDPMPSLLASRALVNTGRGRFVYGGLLLQIMDSLDRMIARYALQYGAEPQLYPATVSVDTLIRSGYLTTFPQHAYFVAPAALAGDSLAGIAASARASDLDSPLARGWYGAHDQVLAPTVCYHCFESQQGMRVTAPCSFTAVNHCSRFEIDADASLARLHTFRMRELVGFGAPEYVTTMLDNALEWSAALLRRWGIGYRVVIATDPFFAGAQTGKAFYQSTFALKRELRLRLPFDDSWLAITSFNNHQQSYTRVFGITGASPLASGCIGWGYERFAYGLLASIGLNPGAWPDAMRADLGITIPRE
jgi:hypothetical protein